MADNADEILEDLEADDDDAFKTYEPVPSKHNKNRNIRRLLEQRIEEKRLKRELEDDYSDY